MKNYDEFVGMDKEAGDVWSAVFGRDKFTKFQAKRNISENIGDAKKWVKNKAIGAVNAVKNIDNKVSDALYNKASPDYGATKNRMNKKVGDIPPPKKRLKVNPNNARKVIYKPKDISQVEKVLPEDYLDELQAKHDFKKRKDLVHKIGKDAIGATGVALLAVGGYKVYKKHKEKKLANQMEEQQAQYQQIPQYDYPQMQQTAGAELDMLYIEKFAEEEATPNLKEQIPDLQLELKYKPEIKKEETPGGKMTPSKYVQRKNKQRYNA